MVVICKISLNKMPVCGTSCCIFTNVKNSKNIIYIDESTFPLRNFTELTLKIQEIRDFSKYQEALHCKT